MKPWRALAFFILYFIYNSAQATEPLIFLQQNSSPKYFAPGSDSLGLCGEINQLIQQHLRKQGIKSVVNQDLLPIKRILLMLEQGKAHMFCGAGRNAKREKQFIYSKHPVYSVSNVVAANLNDDIVINSLEDLVSKQIIAGALQGTSSSAWAKKQGIAIDDAYHDLDTPLKIIGTSNNLRLFYYHDLGLNYLTKTSPYPLKVLPVKFRTTPQWMLYSPHMDLGLINSVDNIVKEITDSGELKAIQDKYLLD